VKAGEHLMMQEKAENSKDAILLLGATSGIMRALAAVLAGSGRTLVLAGRDSEELKRMQSDLRIRFGTSIDTLELDVAESPAAASVLRALLEGRKIEGVVAGIGCLGDQSLAENDEEQARLILETNFVGPAVLIGVLAQYLERQRRGFICVLSSVAGDRGRQSNYVYGSAKAGLSAYLEGLRNRMHRAGVAVITVKPGFVDTGMTWGLPGMFLVASPLKVSRRIARAIERRENVVYVPGFWRWIMMAIRLIPEPLFKRLKL
jgi:decaprenylphospho-beta-D-erythro-pentofuranosid-2-ulose 2-reductase